MVGWHHQLYEHGCGWILGVGDGQEGLACCDSWGHKESDMTEQLNWTKLNIHNSVFSSVQSLSHVRLFVTPWITPFPSSVAHTNCPMVLWRSTDKLISYINNLGLQSHFFLKMQPPLQFKNFGSDHLISFKTWDGNHESLFAGLTSQF